MVQGGLHKFAGQSLPGCLRQEIEAQFQRLAPRRAPKARDTHGVFGMKQHPWSKLITLPIGQIFCEPRRCSGVIEKCCVKPRIILRGGATVQPCAAKDGFVIHASHKGAK
jgi:hypothetical protein